MLRTFMKLPLYDSIKSLSDTNIRNHPTSSKSPFLHKSSFNKAANQINLNLDFATINLTAPCPTLVFLVENPTKMNFFGKKMEIDKQHVAELPS
jgi:hypothetical protein